MSNHSDFSSHSYEVIRELGRNREAGRITYLAKQSAITPLDNEGTKEDLVVIKEFRFAMGSADWSSFKAYQREIELLQQLNHPRIPRYLDSFETASGFCLVQEYKNAPSLSERRSFTPEEIKQIAVSVLEILVYLQKQTPAVIHRDIKPENILVDKQLNAYLIDFGFARIRGGEMALSSVAAGTVGFMPPEEQFGRALTEASDLYSLGATLICLVTGTRSVDIGKLIDDNYRFEFKKLVPKLKPRFVDWLTKMVEPNLKNRYGNAAAALEALKPIDVVGSATLVETLFRSVNLTRKPAVVAGLATLGVVSIFGANLIISQLSPTSGSGAVNRLWMTGSCEKCDLRGADLMGAYLGGANLVDANLVGANLVGANLRDANLRDANLARANLRDADLGYAKLGGADLGYAKLGGADLGGADLVGAELWRANLGGAKLLDAKLVSANLGGANLRDANLARANLGDANLSRANLRDANLARADLGGAYLGDAYLVGADLGGADLARADLGGANLGGARLEGSKLENTNLKDAIMPDGTKHE